MTAGAPILDHVAKERMSPPPLPSAALLKLKDPVKDRQAGRQRRKWEGRGDKEKSTATVALSASGLELVPGAPAAPGPRTHTTGPLQASTRPTPEVTIFWAGATH